MSIIKQCKSCGMDCREDEFFCHECGGRDFRSLTEDEALALIDERADETMAELDAMMEDMEEWEAKMMAELDAMSAESENGEPEEE
ncbi:hypothetical protein IJT93_07000 [bacterium]|nr:hypothetical protein [bacterium]